MKAAVTGAAALCLFAGGLSKGARWRRRAVERMAALGTTAAAKKARP